MPAFNIHAAVAALMLLASTGSADADEHDLQSFVSSAHVGHVMQFSYPPDWIAEDNLPTKVGLTKVGLATDIPGVSATASIRMEWGPIEWENLSIQVPYWFDLRTAAVTPAIINALKSGTVTSDQLDIAFPNDGTCGWAGKNFCVEFRRSPVRISKVDGIQIEYARFKIWDITSNSIIDPTQPSELAIYFAMFRGDIRLRFYMRINLELSHLWPSDGIVTDPFVQQLFEHQWANSGLEMAYQAVLPEALKILRSAKFLPVSDLDPSLDVSEIYSSKRIRITERRSYNASAKFWITIPSSWEALEIEASPADPNYEAGNLIVQFILPPEPSSVGYPESLYIILSGMTNPPLYPADYFVTADQWAKKLSPENSKLDTVLLENLGMGIAHLSSTYLSGTGKTQANTYSGFDGDGNALKFRIFTAGGQTMAANVIFLADKDDYDRLLPEIEKILGSLRVDYFVPSMFE